LSFIDADVNALGTYSAGFCQAGKHLTCDLF